MDENLMELAQARIERTVSDRVAAITAKSGRPSAEFCEDCGSAIPEARRQAVSGVQRCAPCQGIHEQKLKHFR